MFTDRTLNVMSAILLIMSLSYLVWIAKEKEDGVRLDRSNSTVGDLCTADDRVCSGADL
jgi:hypothetical protein